MEYVRLKNNVMYGEFHVTTVNMIFQLMSKFKQCKFMSLFDLENMLLQVVK